jgi:hypothetical protein
VHETAPLDRHFCHWSGGIGVIVLRRGEAINALWLVTAAACIYATVSVRPSSPPKCSRFPPALRVVAVVERIADLRAN